MCVFVFMFYGDFFSAGFGKCVIAETVPKMMTVNESINIAWRKKLNKKKKKLNFSNIELECKQTVNIRTIRDKMKIEWKKEPCRFYPEESQFRK